MHLFQRHFQGLGHLLLGAERRLGGTPDRQDIPFHHRRGGMGLDGRMGYIRVAEFGFYYIDHFVSALADGALFMGHPAVGADLEKMIVDRLIVEGGIRVCPIRPQYGSRHWRQFPDKRAVRR
jgi:hypothetical protein